MLSGLSRDAPLPHLLPFGRSVNAIPLLCKRLLTGTGWVLVLSAAGSTRKKMSVVSLSTPELFPFAHDWRRSWCWPKGRQALGTWLQLFVPVNHAQNARSRPRNPRGFVKFSRKPTDRRICGRGWLWFGSFYLQQHTPKTVTTILRQINTKYKQMYN